MHRAPASCPVLFAVLFALPLGALATARAAPPVLDPSGLPLIPATTSATLEPTAGVPLAPASSSDGSWFRVPTVIQPVIGARQEHSMVYDPVRQRFLAFGGHPHFAPGWFNDVWERPLGGTGEWTPLTVTGSLPPARRGHSAVYDPVGDRMIVYAGYGQAGSKSDVWELTLGGVPHWNQLLPTGTAPGARFAHSAVFDASRNRMVVFGGYIVGPDTARTWALDLTTSPPAWQPLDVPEPLLTWRAEHAAIYDPVRDRMVVFGGSNGSTLFGDLWTLSFSPLAWTQQAASNPFGKRSLAGCAYDSAHDRMIVTCGRGIPTKYNDVLSLDLGTFAWSANATATPPPAREAAAFAFDPVTQTGILQGGYGASQPEAWTDTWALTFTPSATWTNLVPNADPSPPGAFRYGAAGAYDATRNRFVMTCGGFDAGSLVIQNDVLALQIGTDSAWVRIAASPPIGFRRTAHSATLDPARDRLLVFGGYNGAFVSDLWEVRFSPTLTINALSPTGTAPSPRDYHAAIYDPIRDRLVIFGGNQAGTPLNDVRVLTNLSGTPTWSGIPVVGTPPSPRYLTSWIYDPYGDRMLVFGGFDGSASRNDLWALSFAGGIGTWTQLAPAGTPPSIRYSASMVLDANRQRAVLYGGKDFATDAEAGDVWQLTLGGQPLAWSQLSPAGTIPPARYVHLGLFDPIHDRLLVSGGASHTSGTLSDVWRLQFGDVATAALLALLSSDVSSDRVQLRWGVTGGSGTARLERRDAGTDWRTIDSRSADGTSALTFVDRDVMPGGRYGYRLVVSASGETSTSDEVWVDVPAGARLALAGFSPNPAAGGSARVAFSLADRTPAAIEVVDVTGRRVASERLAAPSPGAGSIAIAPRAGLPPGLYFVKLTQGGTTLVRRGSVMR